MLSYPLPRSRIGHAVAAFGLGMMAVITTPQALASSHREAPFVAMNPSVDATDLYMFRSYETGRSAFVTILANYQPLQSPQGGPNFFMFNPAALYEIHMTFIIGLDDKDKFNASKPKNDVANFADYVTNPVLPALIESLFPSAKAPTNFPRTDLVTVFLKGIDGVNQPKNVVASEMLRLNTSTAVTAPAAQNQLGVAGADLAGFPNGRRPADDVVDLSLRVAMGALCVITGATDTLKVGCKPADALAGALALTDGVRKTAANYGVTFPYLTTPLPGNFNPPAPAGSVYP